MTDTTQTPDESPTPKRAENLIRDISRELRTEICEAARVTNSFPSAEELSAREKRTLVRSVFAYVEAISHALKADAIKTDRGRTLSAGELLLGSEQSFELADNGEVKTRSAKLRTLPNVLFAFQLSARVHGSSFLLDTDANGWKYLKASLKVWDRITHPKGLASLSVTGDEYDQTVRAFIWIERQLMRCLRENLFAVQKQLRERGIPTATDSYEVTTKKLEPLGLDEDV